jgi:ribonuclease-3
LPIRNRALLETALRHPSVAGEPVRESYERLEFFGDSILGMVIAEYLYEKFPDWDQGRLSKAKATVVQEAPLAEAARRLGLERFIQIGNQEPQGKICIRNSVLADVFEALIAAIYLEQGFPVARWFILEHLHPYLDLVAKGEIATTDYKSRFQELAQARWRQTPTYRVISEEGEPHEKTFVVEVLLGDEVMGTGTGKSKKEAEQNAAREALALIERAEALKADVDYSALLQKLTHALWGQVPTYRVASETGKAQDKTFVVEVLLDGEIIGTGTGKSKNEAEQAAAREALHRIEGPQALRALSQQDF